MAMQDVDTDGLEFRLRNVRAGIALSVACCLYLLAYCLVTWSARPHREVLLGVVVFAIVTSLALLPVPLAGVLQHPRRREAFFLGWSTVLIALITGLMLLDGGVSSPVATVYF